MMSETIINVLSNPSYQQLALDVICNIYLLHQLTTDWYIYMLMFQLGGFLVENYVFELPYEELVHNFRLRQYGWVSNGLIATIYPYIECYWTSGNFNLVFLHYNQVVRGFPGMYSQIGAIWDYPVDNNPYIDPAKYVSPVKGGKTFDSPIVRNGRITHISFNEFYNVGWPERIKFIIESN